MSEKRYESRAFACVSRHCKYLKYQFQNPGLYLNRISNDMDENEATIKLCFERHKAKSEERFFQVNKAYVPLKSVF